MYVDGWMATRKNRGWNVAFDAVELVTRYLQVSLRPDKYIFYY